MKASSVFALIVFGVAIAACSSSNGSNNASDSGAGSAGSEGEATGCTVTFGADASSVQAMSCTVMGPFVSDSTVFDFHGSASGLDAPLYDVSIKYPNGIQTKTYQTSDLFYVSASLDVKATGKTYYVDFDSRNASATRTGSVTTTFTSASHGTIDVVLDSTDPMPAHATVHIVF